MRKLRLKADGRIVEIDESGDEVSLASAASAASAAHAESVEAAISIVPEATPAAPVLPQAAEPAMKHLGDFGAFREAAMQSNGALSVKDLRARASLTQTEFADRLGVPVETIRNWEQGKRAPRGPARALLSLIEHAPDVVFAVLGREQPGH